MCSVLIASSVPTRASRWHQYQLLYTHPQLIADPYLSVLLKSSVAGNTTLIQVISKYGMLDSRSQALVETIWNTNPGNGITTLVDGGTAGDIDYVTSLYTDFPKAVLIISITTYIVLLLLFRSLVLPLKAILMNTLSILASYGALVVIFQDGFLHQLLNFTPLGFVEATSPILLFCSLFGLSMDYEVFLLSRVQEAFWQTGDNTRAVALGLQRSGGLITSAAAIVVVVSLCFAYCRYDSRQGARHRHGACCCARCLTGARSPCSRDHAPARQLELVAPLLRRPTPSARACRIHERYRRSDAHSGRRRNRRQGKLG